MPPAVASAPSDFRPSLREMLHRYHTGWYPCFLGPEPCGPIGWSKYSHRGIHWLDKLHVGKTQRRDVADPTFEIRCNTAFERVLDGCADLGRDGFTWITPHLFDLYAELHRLGHAHSFECWQHGRLVGGSFGVQLGALMTVESMFHTVDNASKAAYVRMCLHLRERGFRVLDVNNATPFFERFGAETVRQWRYEEILRAMRGMRRTVEEKLAPPRLPLLVRAQISLTRMAHAVGRRLGRCVKR